MALKKTKRRQCMPLMPAMIPFAWRRPSMNRATTMILPPCRLKKTSALSSRSSVRKMYLPHRRASARPPKCPMAKPMLSPTTAATKPTIPTTTTLSLPAPAKIAAAMSMVSPGTGTPKSSTMTRSRTAQYP